MISFHLTSSKDEMHRHLLRRYIFSDGHQLLTKSFALQSSAACAFLNVAYSFHFLCPVSADHFEVYRYLTVSYWSSGRGVVLARCEIKVRGDAPPPVIIATCDEIVVPPDGLHVLFILEKDGPLAMSPDLALSRRHIEVAYFLPGDVEGRRRLVAVIALWDAVGRRGTPYRDRTDPVFPSRNWWKYVIGTDIVP
uniref:DUF1618 domain-containing protein n=1 Tax=Setaria digitata TaxID=48799 RepID=A0A915PHS4_9BILA